MALSQRYQEQYSRGFYDYIRHIGQCKSKQEEDQVVAKDLVDLKAAIVRPNMDAAEMRECVTRVIYAEMLGHRAEFGHIHCVNLSSTGGGDLHAKRTGHLATWLCIPPESDLMYLVVAGIQRDLKSSSFLVVSAALDAAARLLRPELMTAVAPDLEGLLSHPKALVRRKTVEAMHAFYSKSAGETGERRLFRQALTDRDPSVMDAAVRLLCTVAAADPEAQTDLLDAALSILSQVVERRLPRPFDFHTTPAPWLQMRLVRLVAVLVVGSGGGGGATRREQERQRRAEKAAPVLTEVMHRADNGRAIGFALIAEVVAAVAVMPLLQGLLELAAGSIAGFLEARSANVRYMGMKMLSQVAVRSPQLAARHQGTIMACLEDRDEAMRRRAMALLFAICDEGNIAPITRRLVRYLSGAAMRGTPSSAALGTTESGGGGGGATEAASDAFLKRSLTRGLCLVAERYAPSASWYVHTMNRILLAAPECVPDATVQRMLKLVAEGPEGVDEAANTAFRTECVEAYFSLTGGDTTALAGSSGSGSTRGKKRNNCHHGSRSHAVPGVLSRIAAWVMGEYGFLTARISRQMLLDRLCDMLERADTDADISGSGQGGGGGSSRGGGNTTVGDSVAVAVAGDESGGAEASETGSWILTAIMKLTAQSAGSSGDGSGADAVPDADLLDLVARFKSSRSVGLQQRAYEFFALAGDGRRSGPATLMRKALPLDGCCEDLRVDVGLSFLSPIVATALQSGAKAYDERRLQAVRATVGGGYGGGGAAGLLPMDKYQRLSALHPHSGGCGEVTATSVAAMFALTAAGEGTPTSLGLSQPQPGGSLGITSSLRGWHGAKRWGIKDLEATAAEEPAATAETETSAIATGAQPHWNNASPSQACSTAHPRHVDPSPTAAAAAPKFSKNTKFMKDIFGSVDAFAIRKPPASADIFGGSSSPPRATASAAATDAEALTNKDSQRSALDDLFPSSGAKLAAAHASTLTTGGGAPGTVVWGSSGAVTTATTTTAAVNGSVDIRAARSRAQAGKTIYIFTITAADPLPQGQLSLTLVSPAAAPLRVLRIDGVVQASGGGPAACRASASLDGLLSKRLPAAITVEVDLSVTDIAAFASFSCLSRGHGPTGQRPAIAATVCAADGDDHLVAPTSRGKLLATTRVTFTLADILRPVGPDFTTAAFGAQWLHTVGEATAILTASDGVPFTSPDTLARMLTDAAGLRVVEVIDAEWISASSVAAASPATTVLCHLAVTGDCSAAVTVRCSDAALRGAVIAALRSLVK